jgi:hypothetical protein
MTRMNRRQFTASLGAVATLPLLPLPTAAAVSATAQLPPAAYAWAHLYARAQPTMSAAKLAQYLRVDASVAHQLFGKLVSDGVLGAPSALGSASALKPFQQPTAMPTHARDVFQQIRKTADTLVKDDPVVLDADDHTDPMQENPDASPDQHLQEIPSRG